MYIIISVSLTVCLYDCLAFQDSELLYEVEVPGPPTCLHLSENNGGQYSQQNIAYNIAKFTRMKCITYIYAQFTETELYPVARASNRGLHPVTWALRKKCGQCFVIWVSKCQLTDWIGI